MESPEKIADLLFKYLKDELSEEEKPTLQSWISSSRANRKLFNELNDSGKMVKVLKQLDKAHKKMLAR